MKKFFLHIFETIFNGAFLNVFTTICPLPLIPVYHTVSNQEIPHTKYLYEHKNWDEFKNEINVFIKYFTKASSMEELIAKKSSFLLTFDDGLAECYNISKYLKKNDLKAIFFICPNFIDNKEMMYRHKASLLLGVYYNIDIKKQLEINEICNSLGICEGRDFQRSILSVKYRHKAVLDKFAEILGVNFNDYLENKKPYLTSVQIEEMIEDGFYFGAHSLDHPHFSILNEHEKKLQILNSLAYIEKFNIRYKYFAFPFLLDNTIVNQKLLTEISGNLVDYTFSTKAFSQKNTPTHFQRYNTENINKPIKIKLQELYLLYYLKYRAKN